MKEAKIQVYLKTGGVVCYKVRAKDKQMLGFKVREHLHKIRLGGVRHTSGKGVFEWYLPHWIDKFKVEGDIPTNYPSTLRGV